MECGQQYYNENESDLKKVSLVDHPVPNYASINRPRPTLGCRALVQRRFEQIPIIVRELQDWKEEVRLHSLKLLHLIVFYAESNFCRHFDAVYTALAKCCQDTDVKVVAEAKNVGKLMGVFIKYQFWFERKLENMKNMKNVASVGVLRLFGSLFSGVLLENKMHEVERVSCLLSYWEVFHNLDPRFQNALQDLAEQLIDLYLYKIEIKFPVDEVIVENVKASEKSTNVRNKESKPSTLTDDREEIKDEIIKPKFYKSLEERFLLQIMVKVWAFSDGNDDKGLQEKAMAAFLKLAKAPENLPRLYEAHLGDLIGLIQELELEHTERSDRIILLCGCLKLCGFRKQYFIVMKNALVAVLRNSETNARIKILSAISMVFLNNL